MRLIAPRLALAVALGALAAGGCTVDADPADLDGYLDWHRVETEGELPAHEDTIRDIYVNDAGREYGGTGAYPQGTVIVKEVYARDGAARGELMYPAIMRKLGVAPPGGRLDGGWQFTITARAGDPERQGRTCWDGCHIQGPYDGAWLDYGE